MSKKSVHFQKFKAVISTSSHVTPTYSKTKKLLVNKPLIEIEGHLKEDYHILIFTKKIVPFESK
jgi:hypothetical protein